MSTNEFGRGYITCCEDRMVNRYNTLEEAKGHIEYQKKQMHSTKHWFILHIKDIESIEVED